MADTKGLNHILMNNNYDYQKAPLVRRNVGRMVGPGMRFVLPCLPCLTAFTGVLVMEGDEHKRQVPLFRLTPSMYFINMDLLQRKIMVRRSCGGILRAFLITV